MTASELDIKVSELIGKTDFNFLESHLTLVGSGQVDEVFDRTGKSNRYYQWLHCLMKVIKPEQVVELGAAAGISTILIATALPGKSKLVSVDCDPISWRWMNRNYPQVIKVPGNDLDLSIYPKNIDLSETDIWFIDALHTGEHLQKEIDLYRQFWKKGTIIVFDDIRLSPDMNDVWNELPYDKFENTNPCHYSGFGVAIV